MSTMQSGLKKIFKAFLWMALSFVLFFLILAALIQIPSIQTRIVQYATTFVSNKTHTKVEIKSVSISFPKSIVIKGLFLEDENRDTLIFAGKSKINVALFDLFRNKIAISSFDLEDATVKLHSTGSDPLFNYNFLLTAFTDTTTRVKADSLSASKWTFRLDQLSLKNVRFSYRDEYAGMNVFATVENSEFNVEEFDLEKSIYQIDEMTLDGLLANVRIKESGNSTISNPESVLPKISARKLQIRHATINFTDSVGNLSVNAGISGSEMEDFSIDLQTELLNVQSVRLSESQIRYHDFSPALPLNLTISGSGNNWQVSVKSIEMSDNVFVYKIGDNPELKGLFDPNNIQFSHLDLEATDFFYSSALTKASVKAFNAIDQNNFAFTSLETDFSMEANSITTNKLKFTTVNSKIDADFDIQFSSLTTLIDSLEFTHLDLSLRNLRFKNSDLLYFNPDLIAQPFFKNRSNSTIASGKVNGSLNNLSAKNLYLKTGANTIVKTDFTIKGLPDYKTAFFDFPNLSINTCRKDMILLGDTLIPESIELPENITLLAVFKGQIKSFEATANMNSSFGDANLVASIDKAENFSSKVNFTSFDLGSLLKDTIMYGPVSLTAEASGQGLDIKTTQAKIKAEVTQMYVNKYNYHNLKMDGTLAEQVFNGKLYLKDENADFDLDGQVNLNPGMENYQFNLNLQGADLQKLNFTKDDIRIGLIAQAEFKGKSVNNLNGKAVITNLVVAHDTKNYTLESVILTTLNEPGKSEFTLTSPLIDMNFSGHIFPSALSSGLGQFLKTYFIFSDSVPEAKEQLQDFNFGIQLHNHPLISQVLFPEIQEFQPGIIQGSFDSQSNNLKLNATINKITYGTTDIKDFSIAVNSDTKALNYQVSCRNISNSVISLDQIRIDGKLEDNKISTTVSSLDEKKNKKLLISTQLIRDQSNYKLTVDPADFYMMYEKWNIAADNSIEFGKQGLLFHHFFLNDEESQLHIASVNDQFNGDINIDIRNFALDDISGIFQKDTSLVKGVVDGKIVLKRVNNSYGLIADAKIANLFVSNILIGNLKVKAENQTTEKFNVEVNLSGAENNLSASGYYIPKDDVNSIHLKTTIQSLSLKTVQAFSMGTIIKASGNLSGNILIEGNTSSPEITGEMVFNNALITPAILNNPLELKHETFQLKNDGIYFNSFTILDKEKHSAILDGTVQMKQFSDFKFALNVTTKDFLLFNTTSTDNNEFYGRMIIDSKIAVTGPMSLPVVNAKLKLKKGSNFTFVVPEDQLTTDKGEDVVEFETGQKYNPILYRAEKKETKKTSLTGFDVSSVIEIDKEATLRLLMDPSSTDSLVVRGDAALSFTIDRSGKMSLTGAYNLNDGSYMASLESVFKRRFDINRGSTIIWDGDPYNADISINASYSVRASPVDLMADQMSGLSETDRNGYKQRYPFLVLLKLRGEILHPDINFEIQLAPEEKGILGGAVNQKLNLLNEDESALNKQVFALLVLGRFIQENPLQTETGGTSTLVRATVGKILSQQLNQWGSKVLPGVDLNFDVQSYNDFQSGQAQGRTQVDIGVKKQLFNERLSIQLGGTVDVEGEKARQNSASNITSDVDVEYKLTKDGRYRLKGFRHNQYEGVIEGQLIETGAGILYVRDFNKWKEFFRLKKPMSDTLKMMKNK